jgi:glucose/arabinose dehydrogenase
MTVEASPMRTDGTAIRRWTRALVLAALAASACQRSERAAGSGDTTAAALGAGDTSAACPVDNGGITLPAGFCATVFADTVGHARHMVVAPNGTVYVNTWSGRYYGNAPAPRGGFLVALRDTTGDGVADVRMRFGDSVRSGGIGGTGIGLHDGDLFAEANDRIVRYDLPAGAVIPSGLPTIVVRGLPLTGDHPAHPFAIDASGVLFVNSGSATNACGVRDRTPESRGHDPCTELRTRAGLWRYDANRTGQAFSPAERFATGIRNTIGIAIGPSGALYATQHGRDQLAESWPALYTAEQGQNLPAEELLLVQDGGDYGWPYCYYDDTKRQLVLAPEYGGNGSDVGRCASMRAPIATFPAHWAPNGLVFYSGNRFPARYRGGAFVAFHGSWNRAPGPQGGYNVVFVPFSGGTPSGPYETFADGFAGQEKSPDRAAHRPSGLAVGQDGSLYISDDKAGRIWRVVYRGAQGRTDR